MKHYILGIDQGTTGSTAILIRTSDFTVVDKENTEHPQYYPYPGWVEHDLEAIWASVQKSVQAIWKRHPEAFNQLQSIGVTNQRETVCAFNKKGEALSKAIVWQDRRTQDRCQEIKNAGDQTWIQQKTGLVCDPYFSATKMQWLLKNNPAVQKANLQHQLCFGTVDTYLLYKLTQGTSYSTEPTNASRTLLMNLETTDWDPKLLNYFHIERNLLPNIQSTFSSFGVTRGHTFLPDDVPITCLIGDQQSALFGQGLYREGGLKCTYGTGAFVLLNTGNKIRTSSHGLLTTVAYSYKGLTNYAIEGSTYIAGAAVQWLRDQLHFIEKSRDVETLASQVTNYEALTYLQFFPFFTGLGAPYWRSEAKAALVGITRDTNQSHIAFATLEGIAQSIQDLFDSFYQEYPNLLKDIHVDGGACMNNLLLSIQSNISKIPIKRPAMIETTSFGAGLGSHLGYHQSDMESISSLNPIDKIFQPTQNKKEQDYFQHKRQLWQQQLKKIYLNEHQYK
jgi:glycerol kinase